MPGPVRLQAVWLSIRDRLKNDAVMVQRLAGKPAVYVRTGYASAAPEGPETAVWSRLVIAPVVRPTETHFPNGARQVTFLLRAETHSPTTSHDFTMTLEAIHAEAYRLVHGWTPPPQRYALLAQPIWQRNPPQPPMWSQEHDVWYSSAEYRMIVNPTP